MDSRTRLQTTWSFQEPDRVPIEAAVYGPAREYPGAAELIELIDEVADNLRGVGGIDWGFFGLDAEYVEETIEDVPGEYKRMRRTYSTEVGEFHAITKHTHGDLDPNDYHWERRYIQSVDDLARIAGADRSRLRPACVNTYNAGCRDLGNRGLPAIGLRHPLGMLVRWAELEEVYGWFLSEKDLMHQFLASANTQMAESILAFGQAGMDEPPVFMSYALEMLIPPWLGKTHFEELVFPYDKTVNDAIHGIGGKHRAHCHGNCGEFLELFADMGVDGVEPLEPAPYGDTVLAAAKRRVGDRMVLSGNIPSQAFYTMTDDEVRTSVKHAIRDGAPGGGFTLHETGGASGLGKTEEQIICHLAKTRVFIETALEYGGY